MRMRRGFTLIELLVVMAIITILAAIAYPNYQDYLRQGRRANAKGVLTSLAAAMERHYTRHNSYLGSTQGAVPAPPSPTLFIPDSSNRGYTFNIQELSASGYTLRATPVSVQQGDGYLELTSSGVRRWDRDNSGVIEAGESCWEGRCN